MPSVAKRVEDRPATLGAEYPSCGEGKLLRPQLSPALWKDLAMNSRSTKKNSQRPESTKNSNCTPDQRPKGEENFVVKPSDVGVDGRTDTNPLRRERNL